MVRKNSQLRIKETFLFNRNQIETAMFVVIMQTVSISMFQGIFYDLVTACDDAKRMSFTWLSKVLCDYGISQGNLYSELIIFEFRNIYLLKYF